MHNTRDPIGTKKLDTRNPIDTKKAGMKITNPILKEAYESDWYFPPDLPKEITSHKLYKKAVEEGWHEWIETPLDFEAMKNNYVYDLSRDVDGNPAYWFNGGWVLHDGTVVEVYDEQDHIGYVGKGDHMMRFCETFMYFTKEPLIGQPFRFLPWMRKIVAPLFGWVYEGPSRYRRYQNLYLSVAKKQGKSYLLSAISNFMLVGDGTPKAQCYICACDRNQARIIYDEAAHMVKESPQLSSLITVVDSRARLAYVGTGSFLQVLSADAHRNDGIDSSFTAIDEIHRHPNRKLYTVMERAGLARPQPLMCVITTYGPSTTDGSIWAEIHNEAKAQIAGDRPKSFRSMNVIASAEPITVTAVEDTPKGEKRIRVRRLDQPVDTQELVFDLSAYEGSDNVTVKMTKPAKRFQTYIEVEPIIDNIPRFSEAEANQEWRTLHGVKRANPSADVIFPAQRVLDKAEESRSPEKEAETKQLNFNIVSGSGKRWLSSAVWQACGEMEVQPKGLTGRPAFAGLDFSFGGDLVGFGVAVPKWDISIPFIDVDKPRIDLLTWAWLPDDMIREREEVEQFPYRALAEKPYLLDHSGCVRFCSGRTVDFGQIAREVVEILKNFQTIAVAYDPNFAQFCIPKLEAEGLTCIAHRQGAVSMAPPCKRFSELVHRRVIAHGNNPLLDRAVEGATLHPPDKAGNTYLSKGKSKNRIDVLVAQVMAVGWCCSPPVVQSGAYADSSSGMWG